MNFKKMAFRALSVVLLLQTVFADLINGTQFTDKIQQQCANLLKINGSYFLLDETMTVSGLPDNMHIDWKSGDIYYTLINSDGEMAVYVINKQTGLEKKINVAGGQSIAVDNTNNIVYFATKNGVYKQKEDGSTELYAASAEDVMYATLTKNGSVMYIATYPMNEVYKITQDGKSIENFSAIPNGHALKADSQGNIYFIDSNSTAYVLKVGHPTPDKIEGLPSEKFLDFYVTKDDDDVFGIDEDSRWYYVHGYTASAVYWGSFGLTNVNSFALDDVNNVYLGVWEAIKKFKHYDQNPCNRE